MYVYLLEILLNPRGERPEISVSSISPIGNDAKNDNNVFAVVNLPSTRS